MNRLIEILEATVLPSNAATLNNLKKMSTLEIRSGWQPDGGKADRDVKE